MDKEQPKCFHNGIILIVNCFQIGLLKYTLISCKQNNTKKFYYVNRLRSRDLILLKIKRYGKKRFY